MAFRGEVCSAPFTFLEGAFAEDGLRGWSAFAPCSRSNPCAGSGKKLNKKSVQ